MLNVKICDICFLKFWNIGILVSQISWDYLEQIFY